MAITQVYVDPAINANSGTGTIGDPYGDLQYALNTQARDATNGNQFNVKAGTAEVLVAALTLGTYGSLTEGAPLVIRGYTAAANDGGIGVIDCGGFTLWATSAYADIIMADLHLHTFGNNAGVNITVNRTAMYNCEIDKGASSPNGKSLIGSLGAVIGCYVHDAGTSGLGIDSVNFVIGNYVHSCPTGIRPTTIATGNIVRNCEITGIVSIFDHLVVIGNTIYCSTAATGSGISIAIANGGSIILNNVIEGYSGVGGTGIKVSADTNFVGYNAIYNCTNPTSFADKFIDKTDHDVTLGASPFTNAAGGDFSVGAALKALGWPASFLGASTNTYVDIGAAQRTEPAATAVLDSAGGTYHAPSASEVISTAVFGPSSGTPGTFVVPPVAKVEAGYTYGVSDGLEGELAAAAGGMLAANKRGNKQ